ncbi:MAG: TetR/AcrR family transcriptional regulator [Bacilli bacterium]|nr:TetR/AcrR family transcriptional regulator [Bacilli bacterium]
MTTKEAIIKVAEKQFILNGYEDTTLRKIAAKCNITATAIYRHYKDKEEIFQSVIRPFLDKVKSEASKIENDDYELLNRGSVEEMWKSEEDNNYYFELLFKEHRDIALLVIKERREWLKNLFVDIEYSCTNRYLKKMKELGYKINEVDECSFKTILESYLDAYFHILEMKLSDEEAFNICKTISNFYRAGFRNLLGF